MILSYQALAKHLQQGCAPVYILTGQEPYLMQQAVTSIKETWKKNHAADTENIVITIQQPTDWDTAWQEANSYSLFASYRLLDLRFDKKSLDVLGKTQIQNYLENSNARCLVLIQAPLLAGKQIKDLAQHSKLMHIPIQALNPAALLQTIHQSLQARHIPYEKGVAEQIAHYYHNNLWGAQQLIDQLALIHDSTQPLGTQTVLDIISDQSDFTIYELSDACIAGQSNAAIHILQQLQYKKGEPSLVLWVLAQELRRLIALHHLLQKAVPLDLAAQQLQIWNAKIRTYHSAVQGLSHAHLYALLENCQKVDETIKFGGQAMVWQQLAQLVMALSQRSV